MDKFRSDVIMDWGLRTEMEYVPGIWTTKCITEWNCPQVLILLVSTIIHNKNWELF